MSNRISIELKSRSQEGKDRQIDARKGTNLWYQLRKNGVPIGAACSGVGVCAACAIHIDTCPEGSISPETPFETESKSRNAIPKELRLACLVRVWDDITVLDVDNL